MNEIINLIKKLSSVELMELKQYITEQIMNVSSGANSNSKILEHEQLERKICPNCGIPFSKNGHTKTGVQKYICPICKETCSQTTGTITFSSKVPFEKWKLMIDNLLDGLSIRKMAKKAEVANCTSFSMRHKIMQAISNHIQVKLSGKSQLDEKHFKINLKGTKTNKMPRASKKRKSSGSAGITKHLVNVLSGIDEYDNLFLKIGGLGKTSIDMLKTNMQDIIMPGSRVTTDSESSYIKFCKENHFTLIQIPSKSYATTDGDNLAEINNVHSQLEIWMKKFRGVSTKHLQLYLDWFCYIFMNLKKWEQKSLELKMYKDMINSKKYITRSNISNREFPIDLFEAYGDYHYGIFA